MSRYTLTRSAERDIAECWDYLSQHNPDAADRLMDQFYDRFRLLANNPRLGAIHPQLEAGVRFFVVGQYLVLYEAADKGILILRVLHGRRDFPRVFHDEPPDEEPETDENSA